MSIPLTPILMSEAIEDVLKAGLCPMISGSPGIGKSDIVRAVSRKFDTKTIDMRLAQCDPTDLNGFPVLNADKTRMSYAPPTNFPLQKLDKLPEKKKGWLLFFDEFNSCSPAVQAAAYKIILDRHVGEHKIHKNVGMVCAGNLLSDRAIVNRMSTAMQSRLVHLTLIVDDKDWLIWAMKNNIDHRVMSFIKFRPKLLHNFKPNHSDVTFACPRTWEFTSKIISFKPKLKNSDTPILMGTIGEGPATEFKAFCDIYLMLPTLAQMEADPASVKISPEPSHQFAATSLIATGMNQFNATALIQVMNTLQTEFQVVTMKDIFNGKPELKQNPEVRSWISANSGVFFDA